MCERATSPPVCAASGRLASGRFFWDANLVWSRKRRPIRTKARRPQRPQHAHRVGAAGSVRPNRPAACRSTCSAGPGRWRTARSRRRCWSGSASRSAISAISSCATSLSTVTGDVAWLTGRPIGGGRRIRAARTARQVFGLIRWWRRETPPGSGRSPTAGGHVASEWYGEVEVPLLAGRPWAHKTGRLRPHCAVPATTCPGAAAWASWTCFGGPRPRRFAARPLGRGFSAPRTSASFFGGETLLDAVVADPCFRFGNRLGAGTRGALRRRRRAGGRQLRAARQPDRRAHGRQPGAAARDVRKPQPSLLPGSRSGWAKTLPSCVWS